MKIHTVKVYIYIYIYNNKSITHTGNDQMQIIIEL